MTTLPLLGSTSILLALAAGPLRGEIPIIPKPDTVVEKAASDFPLTAATGLRYDPRLAPEAGLLAGAVQSATGFTLTMVEEDDPQSFPATIHLDIHDGGTGEEAYQLDVSPTFIHIEGHDEAGAFYGAQSLLQLIPLAAPHTVPGCTISDDPRFPWRGMHLDVGRHMFPVADIKKFIDWLAYHKLNSFHWHLTEDQGWRIEILAYPLLTSVGGYRASTPPYGNRGGSDGTPYGGFYTQAEIREVVAYATARHINVVPEIDMPGHMAAAIASYPALGNDDIAGYNPQVQIGWGVHPYTLSPKESTFTWIDAVLTEVCALFPSEYIHIGGDEAPKGQWEQSPFAQAVIAREGLADEHELQAWFIQRVETILANKGRKLIGWDEIREGGLSANASVMNWRGSSHAVASAQEGHDVVMANTSHTYFDYYQSNAQLELSKGIEFEAIGGFQPINNVYGFEPVPTELQGTPAAAHILGCQAQLWSEYMHTWDKVEYMAFPRIAAIAEVAWTEPARKDFADFESRLQPMLDRYSAAGLNHFDPNNPGSVNPVGGATIATSLGSYGGYVKEFAYDGNPDTIFWSNRGPDASDHFTIDLNNTHNGRVTVLTGRASDGGDQLENGDLEASTDEVSWSLIGTFTDGKASGDLPADTTHLRIVPTAPQGSWLIIREFVIIPPIVDWTGGTGNWVDGTNWSAGAVPVTDGTNDARISSGTAHYAAESGDLTFTHGSRLILDGGAFSQSTTHWMRIQEGGTFSISNGGSLSKPGRLRLWRSSGNSLDAGTMAVGQLQVDDQADLIIAGGSTVIVSDRVMLNNHGWIDLTDATLTTGWIELGAYNGNPSFIHLHDGAALQLNAGSVGTATDVITISGGSFVNFAPATTATIFIDHISPAKVETMIADGKFGIDGGRVTAPSAFSLVGHDTGIILALPAHPSPTLTATGFEADGFHLTATRLIPGTSYQLMRGTDLVSFPVPVGSPVTSVTSADFLDPTPPADRAFYRLEGSAGNP